MCSIAWATKPKHFFFPVSLTLSLSPPASPLTFVRYQMAATSSLSYFWRHLTGFPPASTTATTDKCLCVCARLFAARERGWQHKENVCLNYSIRITKKIGIYLSFLFFGELLLHSTSIGIFPGGISTFFGGAKKLYRKKKHPSWNKTKEQLQKSRTHSGDIAESFSFFFLVGLYSN